MADARPSRQLAVWKHSNAVWDIMRKNADEDGVYRGNLSEIFYQLGIVPHRYKVMKALKLMDRIEVLQRSSGYGQTTETKLFLPETELDINEFNKVVDEVYATNQHRKATAKWIADQRLEDVITRTQELLFKVDTLETRVESLRFNLDLLLKREGLSDGGL